MAGSPHRWRDGLCLAVGAGPPSTRSNGFAGRSASRRYQLWTGFPSIIPAVNRDHGARLQADGPAASIGIPKPLKPQSSSILPHRHGPQLARRARRSDAPTVPVPSKLVRCRPEDMVNAIRPWELEYYPRLTNLVSSPHCASARLYVIRRYSGERPDHIDVEALRCRTNDIPRLRVVVPE